jgi:putative endonuclease
MVLSSPFLPHLYPMQPDLSYFVYITTNPDRTVLETGVTADLAARLYELKYGLYERIACTECCCLLYWEKYADAGSAVRRESEIRKMSVKRKQELISAANADWRFLNDTFPSPA